MLLLWALLLCWGMPPQTGGKTHSPLFLRVSESQLETDISDLFSEHEILNHVIRMPVGGASRDSVSVLDHLPFIRENLSKKRSGLDLSVVGDLLSGKTVPELRELLETGGAVCLALAAQEPAEMNATDFGLDSLLQGDLHSHRLCPDRISLSPARTWKVLQVLRIQTPEQIFWLVIEDAKGPEVTLQILSDSLLQVTLRCKLYLSLLEIVWLRVIKNIRIGVRLEQIGNKTQVALEECHTPPGSLSIEILKPTDSLLENKLLKLVAGILDKSLPFLLQKIVCPVATSLLNSLLEDLLHITLPLIISGPDDFQYYVTTTEFTEGAVLMRVQLVTPCSPGQLAPRPEHMVPPPLPGLAQDSMADMAFWLEIYNDILSCLYTSQEVYLDHLDSTDADLWQLLSLRAPHPGPQASNQSRGSLGLIISTPDPPVVHLDGYRAMVVQRGLLRLPGTNNTSSGAVAWQLLSKAMFSSRNQKLKLQFTPHSAMVTLDPYHAVFKKQACVSRAPTLTEKDRKEERLKALLVEFLKRRFLPHHNKWLREHSLPLPNIKGISFSQAWMDFSQDYILLTVPV